MPTNLITYLFTAFQMQRYLFSIFENRFIIFDIKAHTIYKIFGIIKSNKMRLQFHEEIKEPYAFALIYTSKKQQFLPKI